MSSDASGLRERVRTEDLVRQFRGTFGRDMFERIADESFGELDDLNQVPLLATRFTRERLRARVSRLLEELGVGQSTPL